jgi:hypothetical protein
MVGSFAEVWLAKEGHEGVVGINLLEKIQTATLSTVLGRCSPVSTTSSWARASRARSRSC